MPFDLKRKLSSAARYAREGRLGEVFHDRLLNCRKRFRWWMGRKLNRPVSYCLEDGVWISLDTAGFLSRQIHDFDFEGNERRFVSKYLRPGDVFFDIGANIGVYTLIAAARVGVIGHVHAFEPSPLAFQRLQANIQFNRFRNVDGNRVALSSKKEQRALHICGDGFDAWNSLGKPTDQGNWTQEIVECKTLDDYVHSKKIDWIHFIKIDVEGWEKEVLTGSITTIRRMNPMVMIEFNDEKIAQAGSSTRQLRKMLEELHYKFFILHPEGKALLPALSKDYYGLQNLFAVKDFTEARGRGVVIGDA